MQLQPQVHQKYQSIATIIELHIQQFYTKEGEQNHKFLKVDFAYVNPIQDGPFRGCSRSQNLSHIPHNDETLHGYTIPKEDSKNI